MNRMSSRLGLALLSLLMVPRPATSQNEQDLKSKTVMITVGPTQGSGTEHGSGLLLCRQDGQTYVLTARHVLAGKKRSVPVSRIKVEMTFLGIPEPVAFDPAAGGIAAGVPHPRSSCRRDPSGAGRC